MIYDVQNPAAVQTLNPPDYESGWTQFIEIVND
jgi:hypothetical protein